MRLYDEYMLTNKEKEEIFRSYNKLKKKKIDLSKIVEKGGLRFTDDYGTHTNLTCQGYVKEEFRHKISETDLALLALEGLYPDLGGYIQLFPNGFFIVNIDYLPRTLRLKREGKVVIKHAS